MTAVAAAPTSRLAPSPRRLDERLARTAVRSSLESGTITEEAVEGLLVMAGGNRTAVERALGRLRIDTPTAGRAAAMLRLTLARGHWAW